MQNTMTEEFNTELQKQTWLQKKIQWPRRPDIWKYQSEEKKKRIKKRKELTRMKNPKKFIGHNKNIYILEIPDREERECGRKCI